MGVIGYVRHKNPHKNRKYSMGNLKLRDEFIEVVDECQFHIPYRQAEAWLKYIKNVTINDILEFYSEYGFSKFERLFTGPPTISFEIFEYRRNSYSSQDWWSNVQNS